MPLDIALGSMLFLSFAQRLRERFEGLYTERSESIGTSEQALEENGVGINHFTQQLEEIFSTLKLSLN